MPPKTQFPMENIIDAAFKIVRQEGWKGLSARAIAKELNCSTRPIYDHVKCMQNLEEEVVKKILNHFYKYLSSNQTGDMWMDQAIGYIRFAMEEKQLFRCINDEKHLPIQKKYAPRLWQSLGKQLSGHELFKDLTVQEIERIRTMRWIFIHGLSSLINNEWFFVENTDINTKLSEINITPLEIIRVVNLIFYVGLQDEHNNN